MATYFVEINAHYLVKIEIDGSNGAAEHHFLDKYKWVWAANSFDMDTIKTDTFRGTLLHSELVSEEELAKRIGEICDADIAHTQDVIRERELQSEIEALEQQLREKREQIVAARSQARKSGVVFEELVARSNARRPV